jgi:hypothetical protein
MATPWDSFFPHVQPHVPGCPEVVIRSHLRDAAADFCERSEVWRQKIEPDYTIPGVSDYPIDIPTGALLENIPVLYLEGTPIRRVSDLHFEALPTAENAPPSYFTVVEDSQVRFIATPDRRYEFEGVAVLKPALSATGVEDFIFESHGRTIACGAIASLTIIPGKEWTNPELAAYYMAKFLKHSDDAKGRDTRRANMRVQSVRFT